MGIKNQLGENFMGFSRISRINIYPIMKNLITLLLGIFVCLLSSCYGQSASPISSEFTWENFDQNILSYSPQKQAHVSQKDYDRGMTILRETRSNTQHDPANLNAADYWNICIAFLKMQEPKAHLEIAFRKGTQDPSVFCEYIAAFGDPIFDQALPELFEIFYQKCGSSELGAKEKRKTAIPSHLDKNLVNLIRDIHEQDRQYRTKKPVDWEKQTRLDQQNQHLIDSLYQVYHQYIGKSLVGAEHESVMWAVIQHASTDIMAKYLPVIHQAVQTGELHVAPFKMLLDRYYGLTKGYQLFGSQQGFGFEMATEEQRATIMKLYNLK